MPDDARAWCAARYAATFASAARILVAPVLNAAQAKSSACARDAQHDGARRLRGGVAAVDVAYGERAVCQSDVTERCLLLPLRFEREECRHAMLVICQRYTPATAFY